MPLASTPPPPDKPLASVLRELADQVGALVVHLEQTRSALLTVADRVDT